MALTFRIRLSEQMPQTLHPGVRQWMTRVNLRSAPVIRKPIRVMAEPRFVLLRLVEQKTFTEHCSHTTEIPTLGQIISLTTGRCRRRSHLAFRDRSAIVINTAEKSAARFGCHILERVALTLTSTKVISLVHLRASKIRFLVY